MNFRIERFPDNLHREVKARAARQGLTIREYTIRALEAHETMLDALEIADQVTGRWGSEAGSTEDWDLMRGAVRKSIAKAKGEGV